MFPIACFALEPLLGSVAWHSFLSASLIMTLVGSLAFVLLRGLSVQSWRLRSWLVAAVLLQGLMIVRSPVHLGWIERAPNSRGWIASTEIASGPFPSAAGESPTGRVPSRNGLTSPFLGSSDSQPNLGTFLAGARWSAILFMGWIIVVIAMIAVACHRYVRVLSLVKKLKRAPEPWQQQWRALIETCRFPWRLVDSEILISDSVGPLMVRRPTGYCLIVPKDYWNHLGGQQRRSVMLHELAHMERADVWRQLFARFIATMHWFNPVAWWRWRQYEFAVECACDQRVAADGKQAAAGFASALVDLVQWNADKRVSMKMRRGMGFQAMAAPPLNTRITRLLTQHSNEDSLMKRMVFGCATLALIVVSFFQFRLTTAQENSIDFDPQSRSQLRVISEELSHQLDEIASQLDLADSTTERFHSLLHTPSGRIAVVGYLDVLSGNSREEARSNAIPRFVDHHFTRSDDSALVLRVESAPAMERWKNQSKRLAENINDVRKATDDIAARIDSSTVAGGLFKRLMQDPQSPIAVLMSEMDGGDAISRFLSEALGRMLVDQGNGTFVIVESRRSDAEKKIEQFELAEKICNQLKRELPTLAAEYSTDDEVHKELVRYLRNPLTATVAALEMSDNVSSVFKAVEQLHRHFEEVSIDTPTGLKIENQEAWDHLKKIYERVDRAGSVLPRIQEKLGEIAETLTADDTLTVRLVVQMKREPAAVLLAAELPYAEADAGEQLRMLLSEVMTESDGKLSINSERENEVADKARELLQVCRRIRRYVGNIDEMLDELADREFVQQIGDAGRYAMLNEVRRFSEMHRPDPLDLMRQDLFAQTDGNPMRVREERREIVRRLVAQTEKLRAEAANDDF